jgi:hypothetical protein
MTTTGQIVGDSGVGYPDQYLTQREDYCLPGATARRRAVHCAESVSQPVLSLADSSFNLQE